MSDWSRCHINGLGAVSHALQLKNTKKCTMHRVTEYAAGSSLDPSTVHDSRRKQFAEYNIQRNRNEDSLVPQQMKIPRQERHGPDRNAKSKLRPYYRLYSDPRSSSRIRRDEIQAEENIVSPRNAQLEGGYGWHIKRRRINSPRTSIWIRKSTLHQSSFAQQDRASTHRHARRNHAAVGIGPRASLYVTTSFCTDRGQCMARYTILNTRCTSDKRTRASVAEFTNSSFHSGVTDGIGARTCRAVVLVVRYNTCCRCHR